MSSGPAPLIDEQDVGRALPRAITERSGVSRDTLKWLLTGLMAVVDAIAILGSYKLVSVIYRMVAAPPPALLIATWVVFGYLTSAIMLGVYGAPALQRLQLALELTGRAIGRALVIAAIAIFVLSVGNEISRVVFFAGFVVSAALLLAHRALGNPLYRRALAKLGPDTVVLLDGLKGQYVANAVELHVGANLPRPDVNDPISLDRFARGLASFDRVIVACPPSRREEWAFALRCAHVRGELVMEELTALRPIGVENADGVGRIVVASPGMPLFDRAIKRGFDLTLASVGLLLLSPLLLGVAVAIRLEDGGPILFRQRRIGRANLIFTVFKFRSMSVDRTDQDAAVLTKRNDSRVTRVGRFIRASSLDELPQLFNIVSGKMSVVGPRPHALGARAGNALYWEVDQTYWHRHLVKPGLTGLAQVRGFRGPTDAPSALERRLGADLEYAKNWTLWRDLVIILRTFFILRHENAY